MADAAVTDEQGGGAADEADAFAAARAALAALRGQGRGPDGRVLRGNTVALKSGERSARLWATPEADAWIRERTAEILADLGDGAGHIKQSLLADFVRLELVAAGLFGDIEKHGALTGKGRARAAVSLWASLVDRKARLAGQIGLERSARAAGISGIVQTVRGGSHGR